MHVDTVFIAVPDVDEALVFYRDALGIGAGPRYGEWQVLELEGQVRLALHGGMRPEGGQRTVVSLGVDDLAGMAERLLGLGHVALESEPVDTGVARFLTFGDPWGTHVQLIERH